MLVKHGVLLSEKNKNYEYLKTKLDRKCLVLGQMWYMGIGEITS
jgi:hypothetical protein